MSDLYATFEAVREKPLLYLGKRSISDLLSFYYGYCFARMQLDTPETEEEKEFVLFHSWLQQRLDVKTHLSWADIILYRSADEQAAFGLFFELFDEFKSQDKSVSSA